jgi:hypothetical protein
MIGKQMVSKNIGRASYEQTDISRHRDGACSYRRGA